MASRINQKQSKCIEYSRTFVPSSMRSPYWKYFGFPSDNSNNILTKEKIVCNLCGAVIAYNKNTSNLRTHLVSKHADIIAKIVNDYSSTSSTTITKTEIENSNSPIQRRDSDENMEHLEYVEADSMQIKSDPQQSLTFKTTSTGQTFVELQEPVTQSGNSVLISTDGLEYETFPAVYTTQAAESSSLKSGEANDDANSYRIDDLIISHERSLVPKQSSKALVDMLVKDLLSLVNITGVGFQHLYGDVDLNEIKSILLDRYMVTEFNIKSYLENLSRMTLFSLGIESFINCENFEIVHIYFNYYDVHSNALLNVLYKTKKKDHFDFRDSIKYLCMDNCIAIITSNRPNLSLDYDRDIPKLQSFGSFLTNVMDNIFQQKDIANYFEEIFERKEEILSEDQVLLAPDVFPKCPWSKLNFLQYILSHGDFSTDLAAMDQNELQELQEFCEYISPLKITFETISEEQLPVCSIIRPLISKLLNEHFTVFGQHNKYISKIQNLIEVMTASIMENDYLKEATFFDGRFQLKYVDGDENERDIIQNAVLKRYGHLMETISWSDNLSLKEEESISSSSRRSSLRNLFDRISDSSHKMKKPKFNKSNIDIEFERYRAESPLDLERCPLEWWKANSIKYSELSKAARYYLNVPCCITKLDCLDPIASVAIYNKRFILRYNTVERYLWYLYFNQNFYEKIKII